MNTIEEIHKTIMVMERMGLTIFVSSEAGTAFHIPSSITKDRLGLEYSLVNEMLGALIDGYEYKLYIDEDGTMRLVSNYPYEIIHKARESMGA